MTEKERATALDNQERPVEAAEAYEAAIAKSDADLDTYLNLAILYFVCNDGGYAAHHKLSEPFLNKAWNRMTDLLDEAAERFGAEAEISFWKRYFQFILRGADPFYAECERLVQDGTTLVPYFHLFTGSDGEKFKNEAETLHTQVQSGATEKERYIKSVLEGAFKRQRNSNPSS